MLLHIFAHNIRLSFYASVTLAYTFLLLIFLVEIQFLVVQFLAKLFPAVPVCLTLNQLPCITFSYFPEINVVAKNLPLRENR